MASAVAPLREVVLPARHVQVAEVPAPRPAHQPRVLPPVAEAEAALSPPPGPGPAPQRAVEVAGVGVPVAVAAASLLQQGTIIIRDEAFVIDILGSIHKGGLTTRFDPPPNGLRELELHRSSTNVCTKTKMFLRIFLDAKHL